MLKESFLVEQNTLHDNLRALRITVHGIVQGVGFRPFVYRLANEHQLAGTIANNGDGVVIEIQGAAALLDRFTHELQHNAPPIARITSLDVQECTPQTVGSAFTILASDSELKPNTQIAPDIALCRDCLAELHDPDDRRYHYPFINCTNCGPRFTIVEAIPYDRPNTSMKVFPLCKACRQEYEDPMNRRFHAQPNACPDCGPSLSWHDRNGQVIDSDDCVNEAVQALISDAVVAVKGLGGFHLAVNAESEQAIARLRKRKHRKAKPLAIMVKDLAAARQMCTISEQEKELLTSPEHPIVLLAKKDGCRLAGTLAPGVGEIGVMLPYTPLHHLLLGHPDAPAALVMTSGNLSNEPICTGNAEALERLGTLADYFLLHNREIVTRVDDSVIRVMAGKPRLLRRGRGYAPVPLQLGHPTRDILACGAEMKNTFCLVRSNEAFISQHIGELTSPESMDFYTESINHLQGVLEVSPPVVACDMHPDYLSTRYARSLDKEESIAVQHHHAHAAAVMAEHGLAGPVLAVILDGTGHGEDGTVFGGELYKVDRHAYTRLGHFSHLLLPGGDRAAREPWRMGLSLLHAAFDTAGLADDLLPRSLQVIDSKKKELICQMMANNINCPLTSSCGRLFDGVAALLGTRLLTDFEGQAAMELEYLATTAQGTVHDHKKRYQPTLIRDSNLWLMDSRPLVGWILEDLGNEVEINAIALAFHNWLIDSVSLLLKKLSHELGIYSVVLGGGSFQNRLLLEGVEERVTRENITVFSGVQVPVNDGGIALGQAYIGGA